MTAADIINALRLQPHPEGGHFREIYRAPAAAGERSALTSIYYLLAAGAHAAWHRIDASEVWAFHAGAPLLLQTKPLQTKSNDVISDHLLGQDITAGQQPQHIVLPHQWQTARSLGDWTLVGCMVGPGFEFSGFELA